ncbi:MAG: sodium:proton antiporter [Candidatus Kapabacteria bacterium]|nr:sodium:proton antiporter [Candidatus Kapabacteria bacterium]
MEMFSLFSVLISLAAIFSYINIRLFRLPSGILLMLMGTIVSVTLIIAGQLSPAFTAYIKQELRLIDFSQFLLGILLSFLLFAGSLHVNFNALKHSGLSIVSFATMGTILSTVFIGTIAYYLFAAMGVGLPYIACLLFGALISPTDPIAVLGILKQAKISHSIEIKITGESLFNDGVGVVIFMTLAEVAALGIEQVSASQVGILFAREVVGGVLAGGAIGFVGYRLMKSIDHFQTEILISLAMVMGGYSLCHYLHVSGPLAMVIAGLWTGNQGRELAMSDTTRDYLEKFWEVTDEVLNAVLFMLIGLELVTVNFAWNYLTLGLILALAMLVARYCSLWIPTQIFRFKQTLEPRTLEIMTWGGLRGGISIALALSLPKSAQTDVIVSVAFVMVLFSILIQGFTMERFVKYIQQP